jgi:Xaa-Pro aminopeptidase
MNIYNMYVDNGLHLISISEEERLRRVKVFRNVMHEHGVDAGMVVRRGDTGYFAWLKNMPVHDAPGNNGLFIIPKEGNIFDIIGDSVFTDEFMRTNRKIDEKLAFAPATNPNITEKDGLYYKDIESIFRGNVKIGIVNLKYMSRILKDYLLEHFPGLKMVDITLPMAEAKAVKSAEEIETIKYGANAIDRIFDTMGYMLRTERLEKDIVTETRYRCLQMGSAGMDEIRIMTIDMTSSRDGGKSEPEPIKFPGRMLRLGDRINVALRAISYNNYYTALGRCYVFGDACSETKKCWSIAIEAQKRAAAAAKPGATVVDAATAANKYLKEQGVAEDKTAFIYGMGLMIGEQPVLNNDSENMLLKPGMVLTIAPKVCLDGKDPYVCMDTYLVTLEGGERLTKYSLELVELH